jgi:hypothetical protein
VIKDLVLLITFAKASLTIDLDARLANAKVGAKRRGKPAGNKRATRKKCNVIAVALRPDIQHRFWYIM